MFNKLLWHGVNLVKRQKKTVGHGFRNVRKILIMRYGFLGDVLQTTPVLKALHRVWPEAQIDYWVSKTAAPALLNNPHISSINNADQHAKLGLERPLGLLRHALTLRRRGYDLAVCLGPDPFYGFLAWLAGIKFRAGLIVDRRKAAFLHICSETPLSDRVNRQQRYLEVVQKLEMGLAGDRRIEIFWTAKDEKEAGNLLGHEPGRLVALFCGTGPPRFRPWANRRWDLSSWKSLAEKIIQHYPDVKIVLFGTIQEAKMNKEIVSILPDNRAIDLSERTTFSQLAPVLKRCRLLVSNDSSPVFVAAAVNCPAVVIYGPEWPERAAPLCAEKWYPVCVDVDCRDHCASFPDKGLKCKNECMSSVTVDMVFKRIEEEMDDRRSLIEA